MPDPLAIVMSLADRPEYARQALDALRECHGIADCVLLPHVEPGNDETRALVDAVDFCACRPAWNPSRLGPTRNIRSAWRDGFGWSDYVVLVEEDVVLAPDALEYHAWSRGRYRDDRGTFSVTAYHRRPDPCPPELHHVARRRPRFHPWGAGMWADRWALVDDLPDDPGVSWDDLIQRLAVGKLGLHEVYPELARCNNIGRHSTVQDPAIYTPEWYDANHFLKFGAWNHDVAPGEWTSAEDPLRPRHPGHRDGIRMPRPGEPGGRA